MNTYVKNFLMRGFVFGGFGPVVLGIVYAALEKGMSEFYVSGYDICLGIVSTYILAFLQAGATVFNQIEHWSVPKSLLCHFATLYIAYIVCYIANTWIPFKAEIIIIFTAIFAVIYFVIWITVFLTVRATSKRMNTTLN